MDNDYQVYKTEEERKKAMDHVKEGFEEAFALSIWHLIKAGIKSTVKK